MSNMWQQEWKRYQLIQGLQKLAADKAKSDGESKSKSKKNNAPKAEDIVENNSVPAVLADLLTPSYWGGERAGRAQVMAEAAGVKPNWSVRHPLTSATLRQLLYGIGGGVAGSSIGALTGGPIGNSLGLLGAGLGVGYGTYDHYAQQSSEQKRINEAYEKARTSGTLNPKRPEFNTLATIFAPFRGPHRIGQNQAYAAMTSGVPVINSRSPLNDIGYVAEPYLFPTMPWARNIHAHMAR